MSLPTPTPNQPYCTISALQAGFMELKLDMLLDNAAPGSTLDAPSLSFLIQHPTNNTKMLVDLGLRKDWENYTPFDVSICQNWDVRVPQDVVESLRNGGLEPSQIDYICLTHVHFDHVCNPRFFPESTFLVGANAQRLFQPGYPADPNSSFASDLLPVDRTVFLDAQSKEWGKVGPFERTLDFYGDGSLFIVDAPGHLPGHINVLVRTSPDGDWILLAGDSAHHWNIITGESHVAHGVAGSPFPGGCVNADREEAEVHLRCIRRFLEEERTKVIIGHDEPWFRENKDTAFWPGTIEA
ncbi:hypothetical protein VNI00_004930 [Paramarasmius palmivorus]|uniref:Metallo-beta-lactamase domain-containing protein n=1 Tax=Paramarasmius palmivorus TaxID=297713 RepID=A0AAW0DHE8_9AGAR